MNIRQRPVRPQVSPRPKIDPDCRVPTTTRTAKGEKGDVGEPGPRGPQGPAGPPGKAGPPGQVTEAQLAAIVAAVVSQLENSDKLTGPAGPPGKDAEVDLDELARLVAKKLPPVRMRRVFRDGRSIEVEAHLIERANGIIDRQVINLPDEFLQGE